MFYRVFVLKDVRDSTLREMDGLMLKEEMMKDGEETKQVPVLFIASVKRMETGMSLYIILCVVIYM